MLKNNIIPDPSVIPAKAGIYTNKDKKHGSPIRSGMTRNPKLMILLVVITVILIILAIIATLAKGGPKSVPSTISPTPTTTSSISPTIQASSPTPTTEKKWSDPSGFLLTYVDGVKYIHQNDVTQITPITNQHNFVIKFYIDGTFKCEGLCSEKSTTSVSLGDYTTSAKKVYPDNNNQYTLGGSLAFPSTTSNKPLYFFITYAKNEDLAKINEVLASFRFTEDYKVPPNEAVNKVRNEQGVRDLITQYGDEITIINLYEDTANKTWVIGVTRKPEDEPATTLHQYSVHKFTGEVKLLF